MNIAPPKVSFKREAPLELRPSNLFVRMLTAMVISRIEKCPIDLVTERRWPNDRTLSAVVKATSAPAMTSTTGWAKELAQSVAFDMIEALGPASAAIEVLAESLAMQWNGVGTLTVPAFVASANNASFVAEGDPIPVRALSGPGKSLTPYKVASIAVLTREMMESSNAEAVIADTLIRSAALALDAAFFDNAAASAARPAGIRNGIAATTASNNADPWFAFTEDLSALLGVVGQVGGKGPYFLASNVGRSVSMATRSITSAGAVRPIIATTVGNDIIAIAAPAIAAAFDIVPDVETASAGTLVMDTVPGVAGTAGPERELFQTDSIAVKIRWPVAWIVRNVLGVAWLTPTWK